MQINPRLIEIGSFPFVKLYKRKSELLASGKKIYEFDIGDPKDSTPEFIRKTLERSIPKVSQYPTAGGSIKLRQTISDYLKRRFNADVDINEILPTLGSKEAIYSVTNLFSNNPDKNIVISPNPGYFVMGKSAIMHGMENYFFDLTAENNYQLDLAKIPEDILKRAAACWIIYPHMPTGACCNLEYLKQQFEIANKYEILLLSDETYVDFYFAEPPPSILQVSKKGTLAFHSCSKRSGMTSYRSGFIAGDAKLVQAFTALRNTTGAAMADFIQETSIAAWGDDFHVSERRKIFEQKRNKAYAFLNQQNLKFLKTSATFYIWVEAPNSMLANEYAEQLLEHGVAVCPGDFFAEKNSKYFRISLSPELADLDEAFQHWSTFKLQT